MAIKIKKKDPTPDSDESPVEEPVSRAALSANADALTRASWETASWVEENRHLVFGGIIAILIAVIGGYFGLEYLESQKVEASNSLTPAFDAYSQLVEGSAELEALKSNPDLEAPSETFESEEKKWQGVYDEASASLNKHPNTEVALSAQLAKAAAAVKLSKFDEAIALYEQFRASSTDPAMESVVIQGLATAYAGAEKWDEAIAALDELAEVDEAYSSVARYQKARIYERADQKDKAKELYHEILDQEPDHPSRGDIERRLANM